jgi:WD40 repeat protein
VGGAQVWDAHSGQKLGPALQHKDAVSGAVFNHDESRILTWSWDRTAQVWDAHTGQKLGQALQHSGPVNGAMFNHDESRILTWSSDQTAQVWDTRSGQKLGPALKHDGRVKGAVFNHDESRILTWSEDHTTEVWFLDADLDFPANSVELWIDVSTATEFNPISYEITAIPPDHFAEMQRKYEEVASNHAKICKYRDANRWLRIHTEEKR